jgi:hypothetical protein
MLSKKTIGGLTLVALTCFAMPTISSARPYNQPNMQAALSRLDIAIRELRRAEIRLERAAPNKGGHRAKALARTREAIVSAQAAKRQVRRGIRFAR